MQHAFEPNLFAYLLRDGGYATSANYGQKLVNVMKANDLYKYNVPPSSVSLSGIGDIQTELINQAKENLKSPLSSEERLKQLQRDEYDRLVKKAMKDGSPMPKPPAGISLGTVSPDTSSPGKRILNEQNNLSSSAKASVTENTSKYRAADMQKYIKLVTGMMGTNNTKEILSFMEVMVKYLRDIANAPANKRPNMSPTRPVPNVY
jgi:flagellum-specific peptidoglycan hydrolase FlgJ